MKNIQKIIILFTALIFTFAVYALGVSNGSKDKTVCLKDIQNQVYDIKSDFESMYKELEKYKNELSNIGYDDDISDIYNKILDINNKINDLYGTIESYTEGSSIESEKSENATAEPIITDGAEDTQNSDYNNGIYYDLYDEYYGRLCIPELDISVGLYYGYEQYIADRYDSANIYMYRDSGWTIADHNNQEFSKLLNVTVGTKGYIQSKSDRVGRIYIECTDVFYGYNTGLDIVDKNYESVFDRSTYMMYTCTNGSKNVLISLWKMVSGDT